MFNLLVSGHGEWWETPPFTSTIDRFKEYSGAEAEAIDLARPETLRRLEEIPALLMYEVGAGGPHARVVRHGRIRNIVRRGHELAFTFEPDPEHAFLDRSAVLRIADRLGIQQLEQHRTHWAIKDGDIPAELIATGTAERAQRTVAVVAARLAGGEFHDPPQIDDRRQITDSSTTLKVTRDKNKAILICQLYEGSMPESVQLIATH